MDVLLSRLEHLPSRKWGVHETVLCQELGIKAQENLSVRTQLGRLLVALKKGRYRLKPADSWTTTGHLIIYLSATGTPNYFDIHYYLHGEKESFATDSLKEASTVDYQPRYFFIGGFKADDIGQQKFDRIKTQCRIMKLATGVASRGLEGLDAKSLQRRQAKWLLWYEGSDKGKEFEIKDLPVLAKQFQEFFGVAIPKEGRIPPRILDGVAKEIRKILRYCNQIPSRTRQGTSIVDQQQVVVVSPTNKRKRAQDDDTTEDSTKTHCPRGLPESLKLNALRGLIKNGPLDELAAIEFAVHLLYKENLSVLVAAESFQHAGVLKPNSISLDALHKLKGGTLHSIVVRHVSIVREELIGGSAGGLFSPKTSDRLHAWIADGKRYTTGERLPAVNYVVNPDSNQLWLTDKAAHFMRDIVYTTKLPPSRFPSLMNSFAVLLLGRPLTTEEFSSTSTLRNRLASGRYKIRVFSTRTKKSNC
jgi:hypothetical protein